MFYHLLQKEAKGTDPSLSEFYFRTHRRKKDQSWVGPHAESAYVSLILMIDLSLIFHCLFDCNMKLCNAKIG